jgi:hypothetical protein
MGAAKLDNKAMWNIKRKNCGFHSVSLSFNGFLECGLALCRGAEQTIPLADPTIFLDKGPITSMDRRFARFRTRWIPGLYFQRPQVLGRSGGATDGFALVKGDVFGTKWFWAPQIFRYQIATG